MLLAPLTSLADPIRIFVTDSNSWESSGGFGANNGTAAGHYSGGARPQTAEIIKTFGERCPGTTVTIDKAKAQLIVLLDHEGGNGVVLKCLR